jgi:hypothetical protein
VKLRWVAPPNWPELPAGFEPPKDWQPDESWPEPPLGWQFWQPVSQEDAQPPWLRRNLQWVIAAAVVVVILVAGGVVLATHTTNETIKGTMFIDVSTSDPSEANFTTSGVSGCGGTGGYSDLTSGASVTVTNPSGKVIATGFLGNGDYIAVSCGFRFRITGVPKEKFYGIEISHRGVVDFSLKEVQNNDVSMDIGGD